MKRNFLLILAFLLTMGFAHAQDIYFAGNSYGTGKIWKNNTLVQSISDTMFVHLATMQVLPDGTIYTAGHVHDTFDNYIQGRIWLNDSVVFDAGPFSAINAMTVNDGIWTAAGIADNEWENVTGFVWQNGETLYSYSDSVAYSQIHALCIDTTNNDIYTGGFSGELEEFNGTVWKNDTILWSDYPFATVLALTHDGSDLYAAGYQRHETPTNEPQYWATLWQNDEIVFSIPSDESEFAAIAIYDGSIYLAGYDGNTLFIWQDEEVLYSHPFEGDSRITSLIVNEDGVYYAGQFEGAATVWKDGEILYQPEECTVITGLCVLPTPPLPEYTLTVESAQPEWGTVSGGGTYLEGDTATLTATPEIGCEFVRWNDNNADNPRLLVVNHDSTFIASFMRTPYYIEVVSDHPEWGSVSGGGTYYYGDTIQIEALPNPHYAFTHWSDDNTDNPRTVIVTEPHTYIASFEITQYNITVQALPEGAGLVQGGGQHPYGDTVNLIAQSNTGYYFEQWEDGVTDNPRQIIVESDSTFTALFTAEQYEVTVDWTPEEGGTVEGAGTYDYGTYATLKATPNDTYMFISWNDGIVTNPRNVLVTHDVHYRALFYQNGTPTYTVTVVANDPALGEVNGGGTYPEGTTIEISATPFENVIFTGWNDGNTDNPRSVTVTEDLNFKAIFEYVPPVQTYTIVVRSASILQGTVYGSGTYPLNEIVTIGATPLQGFYFTGWQDGNTNNPRTIVVTGDAEYIASFSQEPTYTYTVTVQYDEEQGYVLGAGTYNVGSTATLAAIANDNYSFVKWGDGVTDNPRHILVDHDITLAAFFNFTGVDENGSDLRLYPNPASDKIHIEGLEGKTEVCIFNIYGSCVIRQTRNGEEEIPVGDLTAGLYLMRINGGQTLKFVKR